MLRVLIFLVSLGARAIRAMCRRRADLVIENLALRQQVTALKKERPRPLLDDVDRAFWVALRTSWPSWASRLVIVNTDTVARWNRERFRRYWTRIFHQAISRAAENWRRDSSAVRSLKRPGCVHLVFGRPSSSPMASRSGGLIMMNDRSFRLNNDELRPSFRSQ